MTISPVYVSLVGTCALAGAYAIGKKIKDKVVPFISEKVSNCFRRCKLYLKSPYLINATESQYALKDRAQFLDACKKKIKENLHELKRKYQEDEKELNNLLSDVNKELLQCENSICASDLDRERDPYVQNLLRTEAGKVRSALPAGMIADPKSSLKPRLASHSALGGASKIKSAKAADTLPDGLKAAVQDALVREVKKVKYRNQNGGVLSDQWASTPDYRVNCLTNLLAQLKKQGLTDEQIRDVVLTLDPRGAVVPNDFRGVI